jgi:uncharacterized protein YukE
MDELLKKLLAAEVLTEETRVELEGAIKKQIDEAMNTARTQATIEVTAQLEEQWIQEREVLIEALDAKVSEVLTAELEELRESIESFRDLEIEYAEKLVEAKTEMAGQLKGDIATLVEKLDKFLEIRLNAEIEELREDIDVVKKNEFGRKVFESFVAEFKKHYTEDDSTASKLDETEQRLADALTALEESERRIAKMERSKKLEQVLTPLSGRTKEVMEAILKNVDTNMIEEAYKTYIGRVVKETSETTKTVEEGKTSEKETKVLAEGKEVKSVSGVAKTGDDKSRVDESAKMDSESRPTLSAEDLMRVKRQAGLIA